MPISNLATIIYATVLIFFLGGCKVSYVSFRPAQKVSHNDTSIVTRVYMDRYGDLYPSLAVPIDSAKFKVYGSRKNKTLASLSHYFLARKKRLEHLREFYHISADSSDEATYREAQRRIRANYIAEIERKVNDQRAGRLIYLVHGFNDTMAEAEYDQLRDTLARKISATSSKPVFVDIHWDGLNAHVFDGLPVAKVWMPAQLNSIFASLSLRRLLKGVEQKVSIPTIIITHSLGGGVGLGSLFNTTHRWKTLAGFVPESDKQRIRQLEEMPTPSGPIKIAVIAPAIPGETTFSDFNFREPASITAGQNNINRIIIGYNYKDYAVSKQLLDINFAKIYGATTLGCNYTVGGVSEVDRVLTMMNQLGYGDHTDFIIPLEFQTPFRKDPPLLEKGTREHAFCFYIANPIMSQVLTDIFK